MRIKNIVGAFLCLFTVSATLVAQEEKGKKSEFDGKAREMMMRRAGGEGGQGTPGGMMMMNPVMAALDADKDGTLSVSEIANASKSLMALDKNGDGILSGDEMRPPQMAGGQRPGEGGGAPNGEMMTKMFESQDKNGDGKLTGDEIPERMRERVAQIDEDGDGSINRAEMTKMMARMAGGKGAERMGKDGKDGSGIRPKRPDQNK